VAWSKLTARHRGRGPIRLTLKGMNIRTCSRVACEAEPVSTLTYVYADSMAVLGPLSMEHEPGSYDLCARHTQSMSAPRGWQVVRYVSVGNG
jgi:hypothetical protein